MNQEQGVASTAGVKARINMKRAAALIVRQCRMVVITLLSSEPALTLFACPRVLSGSTKEPSSSTLLTSNGSAYLPRFFGQL